MPSLLGLGIIAQIIVQTAAIKTIEWAWEPEFGSNIGFKSNN